MERGWRVVPGFEGRYEANDQGAVRTLDPRYFQQLRKMQPTPSGHFKITLFDGVKRRSFLAHQIIARTFIGPAPVGCEVRHANGDGQDNRVANLVYGTRQENVLDSVAHGTHHMARRDRCGEGHVFDDVNSYWRHGRRVCRPCRRRHEATNRRNRKMASA